MKQYRMEGYQVAKLGSMIGGTFHTILATQIWTAFSNEKTMQAIVSACKSIEKTLPKEEYISTPVEHGKGFYNWKSNSGNIMNIHMEDDKFIVEVSGGNILSFIRAILDDE